jgi:hypothetical protein
MALSIENILASAQGLRGGGPCFQAGRDRARDDPALGSRTMRLRFWFRALLALLIVGLLALTILWLVVRDEFKTIIAAWRSDMEARGFAIAAGPPAYGGWPLKLEARFAAPVITAPGGQRWEGPQEVAGYAWLWDLETIIVEGPGRHRLEVEGGPLAIDLPEGALTLGFARGGLERVAVETSAPVVTNEVSGRDLTLDRLALDVAPLTPKSDGKAEVGFAFELAGFALPPEMTGAAELLGPEILLLKLEGRLEGALRPSQSWTAFAAAWRDGGGILDLRAIELDWGELWMKGAGTLTLDQAFRPLGAFSFETLGLPALIARATEAGLLEPSAGQTLERALAALATGTDERGRQRVLLPVTLQDGRLYVGQIELGQLRPWTFGE